MGTFVTVGFNCRAVSNANVIFNRVFSEMHKTIALMNHYDHDSEVGRLNTYGTLSHASADTLAVIDKALYFSAISKGAFDISVLPLVRLWGSNAETGIAPSGREIADTLSSVGFEGIRIDDDSIRFLRPGMQISLAPIAKGFVVDKAISILQEMGVSRAVVNGGGDIRVISERDKPPWRIGIQDPLHKKHIIDVVEAHNLSIASSGSYAHACNDIIDPRTGCPARNVIGASTIAKDAAMADAWATCLSVLDSESGMILTEEQGSQSLAALLICDDGALHTTANWASYCSGSAKVI